MLSNGTKNCSRRSVSCLAVFLLFFEKSRTPYTRVALRIIAFSTRLTKRVLVSCDRIRLFLRLTGHHVAAREGSCRHFIRARPIQKLGRGLLLVIACIWRRLAGAMAADLVRRAVLLCRSIKFLPVQDALAGIGVQSPRPRTGGEESCNGGRREDVQRAHDGESAPRMAHRFEQPCANGSTRLPGG